MAAIPNRIVIGNDQDNPIFVFQNDAIISVDSDTSVSLIGEELYINQFSAVVDYYVWTPYVFKPTDYGGFESSDGLIFCSKQNYDIRLLPYGTKIVYYAGDVIAGVFYVKNVERLQRQHYKINAISAIGLMDKQYHSGGVYLGAYFQDVVEEILGQDFDYIIDGVVAILTVYGWLPYATKRENLYQLLMAYGVEIVLGDNGTMFFTFPETEQANPIPASRVFQSGKVIYDEPASRVEVNEHGYHYDPGVDEVDLFDNTNDSAADHTMVIFNDPIYPSSIYCSDGNLTIHSAYANYAVVSGGGVLRGKPYVHNIRMISQENPSAPVEKVVSVQDATLVSFVNADNVLARLCEYYFNSYRVEQDIVVDTEKPGRLYTCENPYNELMTGYIVRMSKNVTSFARAKCRFLLNYTPIGSGAAYTNRLLVPLGPSDTYTWTIPQAVFDKEIPNFRVTLIGKGSDGATGEDGQAGTAFTDRKGMGGAGGLGGAGGQGGNILTVTLSATGLTEITVFNNDIHSALTSTYYNYTSADGAPSKWGYYDIYTQETFALPGADGEAGAAGGNGDYVTHLNFSSTSNSAEDGGDVTFNGTTWTGGARSSRFIAMASSATDVYISGRGGGGAAVGNNGNAPALSNQGYTGTGGIGADAVAPPATEDRYGQGGNGGHGGGGGGAGCNDEYWNHDYSAVVGVEYKNGGRAGNGSAGTVGKYGCAIIYW